MPADQPRAPLPGGRVRGSQTGRPVMALLDLLGRRGTLRILWELRAGPLSFRALQAAAGQNPATLNTRLRELRAAGLVALEAGYALTDEGAALLEALSPLEGFAKAWAEKITPAR